jgi:hypothetical protein
MKRIGLGPIGQNIRIATSVNLYTDDNHLGTTLVIRRVCELTLEVEWRIGTQTAFSRVRVYKFNPDLAYDRMDEIQEGIKSGHFLCDDTWSVDDPFVQYDPHAPTEIVIEDYADVLKWFGADFNPANETTDRQPITDGQKLLADHPTRSIDAGHARALPEGGRR